MRYKLTDTCTIIGKVIQNQDRCFSFLSYLLKGEKNVLIDTVPERVAEVFLTELEECLPLESLDALILNHSEEDHSGAIGLLLTRVPKIPIYCTSACIARLQGTYPAAHFIAVENQSSLQIGTYHFHFTHTPGLHWNDNMVTYLVEEHILFSNDLFGQYLGAVPPMDKAFTPEAVLEGARTYFDKVFSQATTEEKQVLSNLVDPGLECIAPGHGVVLIDKLEDILEFYEMVCLNQ